MTGTMYPNIQAVADKLSVPRATVRGEFCAIK